MDAAGGQVQGARKRQEDAYAIERTRDGGCLALVADGLGGHPGGDVASREAVAEFLRVFRETEAKAEHSPREWLKLALLAADEHLRRRQKAEPALAGMSTTLVALFVKGREAYALSVGDSYLFVLRDGVLERVNELHRLGPALTSTVGFHLDRVEASGMLAVVDRDRYLLASDGMATLDEGEIRQLLAPAPNAAAAVRELLRAIGKKAAPRQDNATVVALFPG